jgi:O-antigen biosynthesis protein WbqV
VAIEDLLGRPQASLDRAAMARLIAGRRVLVTGAGGSIGAELVRQAAEFGPARLVLLDHAEYLLYNIDLELGERWPELPRRPVLADVRRRADLERVFAAESPELVLHAAALKHVPLIEANPGEAVLTNVVGTCNLADLSHAHGVRAMLQVSTDKAIDPASVMGATKRLAESYGQALDLALRGTGEAEEATRFVTVRFGNVLGSTGSVVPLFQRQLDRGGPITVTHPEMTRYFMTVREAVQLVLQAAALGTSGGEREEIGKIYVLDMGEPIRIVDLARQMIRLAGLRPVHDIDFVFTGMRLGEKLHEQLFHPGEAMVATSHPSLKLAAARTSNLELLRRGIDGLAAAAHQGDDTELRRLLAKLVPEWNPTRGSDDTAAAPVRER